MHAGRKTVCYGVPDDGGKGNSVGHVARMPLTVSHDKSGNIGIPKTVK